MRIQSYNSKLYRQVNDVLAFAVLVAFTSLLLVLA